MEKREWVLLAAALGYSCWGCWSAVDEFAASSLPAHRPPPAAAARAPAGAQDELRWESDNRFSRFHSSRGTAGANEELASFRDAPRAQYGATESSLAALARSLDPAEVRAKLAEAERAGASPEAIAHYRYLKEIVEAFLEGRLHELVTRARDEGRTQDR